MKHKKFLLVTFFLTLFVFQQVQAGGTMPSAKKSPQMHVATGKYAGLLFVVLSEAKNLYDCLRDPSLGSG